MNMTCRNCVRERDRATGEVWCLREHGWAERCAIDRRDDEYDPERDEEDAI